MGFLDENYLLGNDAADRLFGRVAGLPVVDPHNHADVKELAENKNYSDPWRLFVGTDHYVWAALRNCSVPERYITGDAPPEEKWLKMAEVFPLIAGNPVYEWIHLDLKRYLGVDDLLGPDTGGKIWSVLSEKIAAPENRPQGLLRKTGVEVMCSTDDPSDVLDAHAKVNGMMGGTVVRPTWRPDRVLKINSAGWRKYIAALEQRFGIKGGSITGLEDILRKSHDYFADNGCVASDHAVETPYSGTADKAFADKAFRKAIEGESVTPEEAGIFADYLFGEMGRMDAEKDWVFQLHIGAVRDVRRKLFEDIGPDSGGDVSNHFIDVLPPLSAFLNRFDGKLRVVLYCLDAVHQATLATAARAFGSKVRLGSAWWFCDHPIGMKRQLEYIGAVDLLSCFAGMVSDSRKLLSYGSRFEMFRRILCGVLGEMVEKGRMPEEVAGQLARNICYDGPKKFFNL